MGEQRGGRRGQGEFVVDEKSIALTAVASLHNEGDAEFICRGVRRLALNVKQRIRRATTSNVMTNPCSVTLAVHCPVSGICTSRFTSHGHTSSIAFLQQIADNFE